MNEHTAPSGGQAQDGGRRIGTAIAVVLVAGACFGWLRSCNTSHPANQHGGAVQSIVGGAGITRAQDQAPSDPRTACSAIGNGDSSPLICEAEKDGSRPIPVNLSETMHLCFGGNPVAHGIHIFETSDDGVEHVLGEPVSRIISFRFTSDHGKSTVSYFASPHESCSST